MFAATVDVFPATVFVTDIEGHALHLNPAAVRISGSSPDLARGRHIADQLYTPLNAELRDQRALLETARRQGHATARLAIPITTYRGEMQLIDYHAIPLTDDAGDLIGGLFIANDFRQPEAISETG
jgi:PAS domain S-box-containing protein